MVYFPCDITAFFTFQMIILAIKKIILIKRIRCTICDIDTTYILISVDKNSPKKLKMNQFLQFKSADANTTQAPLLDTHYFFVIIRPFNRMECY